MIFIILAISANILQTTLRASGPPRHADRPAMQNEAVAEIISFLRRHDLPEFPLYFGRFLDAVHQTDQVAQTDAVSIRNYGRLSENIAHDQVRTLSAHTGESQQLIEGFRDIVIVLFMKDLHAGRDVPRFAGPKPAGPYDLLNFLCLCFCECRDGGKLLIKERGDLIYPRIRALGCQPHAHQKLPRLIVVQRALCLWIFLFQSLDDLKGQLFFVHLVHLFAALNVQTVFLHGSRLFVKISFALIFLIANPFLLFDCDPPLYYYVKVYFFIFERGKKCKRKNRKSQSH